MLISVTNACSISGAIAIKPAKNAANDANTAATPIVPIVARVVIARVIPPIANAIPSEPMPIRIKALPNDLIAPAAALINTAVAANATIAAASPPMPSASWVNDIEPRIAIGITNAIIATAIDNIAVDAPLSPPLTPFKTPNDTDIATIAKVTAPNPWASVQKSI